MKNPYVHRKMICSTESFFGRRRELSRIYSLIESSQQISVVGDRRIGKSSLLCCLSLSEIQAQFSDYDLSEHIFVYIDLLVCAKYTAEMFLRHLLLELQKTTQGILKISIPGQNFILDDFTDTIDQVMDLNKKLVFLLDEFDYVSKNEHFDLDFFNFLRSIAHKRAVSFVTASTKSLLDLCDKSVISSPFFNIFNVLRLGVLEPDDALELIRVPSTRAGYSLAGDNAFILDLAGQHPFLLQLACFLVFETRSTDISAPLDHLAIRNAFQQLAHDHFKYAWEALDREEKLRVEEAIAKGDFSAHPMLSSLPFREYVLRSKVSQEVVMKDTFRKKLLKGVQRLDLRHPDRRIVRIAVGISLAIALVIAALHLGFINGLQQLLLIPLAAITT
jgi:hypothetical protein